MAERGTTVVFSITTLAAGLAASCACEGTRRPLDEVPELPRPECVAGEPVEVSHHLLRAGPDMREQQVVERFELLRYERCRAIRVRQEWPLGTADVEVVFDADGQPLRIWRRTTIPDASGPTGHRDLRVYDTHAAPVRLARRGPTGAREGVEIRGPRPRAVIGPGRGLLTEWIQRAELGVGEQVREPVIDVREPLAVIRDVTLRREADRNVARLGRVRVHTIYGREPVFTDESGVVIGDLFGLRRGDVVDGPVPDPIPDVGPLDPDVLP